MLLLVILGYIIVGYLGLFYWWLLLVILLVAIVDHFIGGFGTYLIGVYKFYW
jgi:hypothetical protein